MTALIAWLGAGLITLGLMFFVAGTVGLLRFSPSINRLHALTKADTLGLGLVVMGLALQAPAVAVALKLVLIWSLALVSAALVSHLIGQSLCAQRRDP
ncbi:monovalent cation/H(+) antiporter subunit G [Thiomicrospira sp. WB1]|uniref:cation:proton antiporter n=1 Tax=Thiomicrospira sp. WB1 TaxID=1685380 RepID=UPI0007477CDF|nr:monovalent cation/H(+) antiporter subunit G [Thiomicrospira sp. WB1]KUJ71089.1 cation:proton antiporter [Thiomicrospira sp. WB1]